VRRCPSLIIVVTLLLNAGCISLFESQPNPDIVVENDADFPIEYTIEIRNESSGIVFSNTTTIEPHEQIFYEDVLDSGDYVAIITFDDGTTDQHGWYRGGGILWVDLSGKEAKFDDNGTF
jgi:hypothetical protein